MSTSPISQWLRQALDSTAILSRAGWACVLGIGLDSISQVVAGDTVPDARTLRSIFLIVQDHESDAARRACERWNELASRPLREAHPTARSEAPTLAHYVLTPLWEDHRLAVAALPAHEQEQILQNGIYEATRWAIARNRAAAGLPLILSDDDLWAQAAAPQEISNEVPGDGASEDSSEVSNEALSERLNEGSSAGRSEISSHASPRPSVSMSTRPSARASVRASVRAEDEPPFERTSKEPLAGSPWNQAFAAPDRRESLPRTRSHGPQPPVLPTKPDELAAPEPPRLARSSSPALDARKELSATEPLFPRPRSSSAARTVAFLRDRPPLHQRLPNPQEQPREATVPIAKKRDE